MRGLYVAVLVASAAFAAWHFFLGRKKSHGERKTVTPFPAFQTTSDAYPTTPAPPEIFATKQPLTKNDLRGGNAGYDESEFSWQGGWFGLRLP